MNILRHNIAACLLAIILLPAAVPTSSAQEIDPAFSSAALAPGDVFNILNYGAAPTTGTLNTQAIQAAIDACTAAGGGTVLVPNGDFVTGTIELKSNVTLRVSAGARLLGSRDIADYRSGSPTRYDDLALAKHFDLAMIIATRAENIAIEGPGMIHGQGEHFFEGANDDGEKDFGRPRAHMLLIGDCRNVRLRDIQLRNSAYHCTRFKDCVGVVVDNVNIHNRVLFNNDGLNFTDCDQVRVSNCTVICEDDACGLFGSMTNVTITNSFFSTRWAVFRFGHGHARNIAISNCVIKDTFGCPVKMQVNGNSSVENVTFSDLVMDNVTGPIYLGLGSSPRNSLDPSETKPGGVIRNIAFRGLRATVAAKPDLTEFPFIPGTPISDIYPGEHNTCISLTSAPGQFIENVSFSDVHITYAGGGTAQQAALRDVPQVSGGEYFACGTLPAYGLYGRNVRGLTLDNVRFDTATPDLRPALVLDRAEQISLRGFEAAGNPAADSLLRFTNVKSAFLSACRVLSPAAAFLHVEGPESKAISIRGSDLTQAQTPFRLAGNEASLAVDLKD